MTAANLSVRPAARFAYAMTIGAWGNTGRGFAHPVDVQVDDRTGRIYVLNRSTSWEAPHGRAVRITVLDWDHNVLGELGHRGDDPGGLMMPTALTLTDDGRVLVTDEQLHRISVFSAEGEVLPSWGLSGSAPGQLNRPAGITTAPDGSVVVVDHGNHRIQRFTADGEYLGGFGARGSAPGEFELPWHLAVDDRGRVWVTDWGNDRIQAFALDGACLEVLGGPQDSLFHGPAGIAWDAHHNLFVTDWGRDRVLVFDSELRQIDTWHGDADLSPWAEERLTEFPEMARSREAAGLLDVERRFWRPTGIAVAESGAVLVTDSGRHRLQVYQHVSAR